MPRRLITVATSWPESRSALAHPHGALAIVGEDEPKLAALGPPLADHLDAWFPHDKERVLSPAP